MKFDIRKVDLLSVWFYGLFIGMLLQTLHYEDVSGFVKWVLVFIIIVLNIVSVYLMRELYFHLKRGSDEVYS